jgi:hypothetical protein
VTTDMIRTPRRLDIRIAEIALAGLVGYYVSDAVHHTGWLLYRNDALVQVENVEVPGSKTVSTQALVAQTKALKSSTDAAAQLGCIEPVTAPVNPKK